MNSEKLFMDFDKDYDIKDEDDSLSIFDRVFKHETIYPKDQITTLFQIFNEKIEELKKLKLKVENEFSWWQQKYYEEMTPKYDCREYFKLFRDFAAIWYLYKKEFA